MVSTVRPKANATPTKPIPRLGKAAANTAAPQPPNTSQKVPKNSATTRRDMSLSIVSSPHENWFCTLPWSEHLDNHICRFVMRNGQPVGGCWRYNDFDANTSRRARGHLDRFMAGLRDRRSRLLALSVCRSIRTGPDAASIGTEKL